MSVIFFHGLLERMDSEVWESTAVIKLLLIFLRIERTINIKRYVFIHNFFEIKV